MTVPSDATTATFDADPAVPSGLVRVGDVLIDDTLPRTVPLNEGAEPTVLTLRATAQDHTTTSTYRIEIAREEPTPPLAITAAVTSRCVAGKVTLVVQGSNASDVPVALSITTDHGSKQIAALAPGRSTSADFKTRLGQVGAGSATLVATGDVGGDQATVTVSADYSARFCG